MVRAKFRVNTHRTNDYGGYKETTVILTAEYDSSVPEDQRFCKATPSGHIEMRIDNQAAIDALPAGKSFYVDFTPVE